MDGDFCVEQWYGGGEGWRGQRQSVRNVRRVVRLHLPGRHNYRQGGAARFYYRFQLLNFLIPVRDSLLRCFNLCGVEIREADIA